MADAPQKVENGGGGVEEEGKKKKMSEVIRLDPELEALIGSASEKSKKGVDSKLLKKTLEAVKDYLRQDVENNALVLLNYKKFLPFFVNCLKDNSNSSSIKFNVAWVLDTILSNGFVIRVEELVSREHGVIPLFSKLLHHPDRTIYEKVTAVMVRLALGGSTRPQLLDISSSIFVEFSKLLKNKKLSKDFVENCARAVCGMLKGSKEDPKVGLYHTSVPKTTNDNINEQGNDVGDEPVERIAVVQVLPSQRLVKNALPVISLLLDSQDHEIQLNMLHCLIVACSALDNVKALVDSGCAPKLASFFSHSEQTMVVGAIIAVGSIAALNDSQLLTFIKALKGTGELKNYYRVFRLDLDFNGAKSVHLAINVFMAGLCDLVEMCDQNKEIIPAIIESGMINSLMEGVKDKDVREDWQDLSIAILGKVLCKSPEERIAQIGVQILPRIVEILEKTPRTKVKLIMRCCAVLATLISGNLERRDWAVTRLDAVDCVVDCLEQLDHDEFRANYNLTYCLFCMLNVKPPLSLNYYKGVPRVMKKLLLNYPVILEKNRINALNVLGLLLSQERTDAVQMIIDADLIPILVDFLPSSNLEIRARAVEIIFHMSLGTVEQRKCLLKGGVLEKIDRVFTKDTCEKTRKNALMTLYVFLKYGGTVKEDQQMIKNKLRLLVEQEIIWNVRETQNSAQKVMDCILKIK